MKRLLAALTGAAVWGLTGTDPALAASYEFLNLTAPGSAPSDQVYGFGVNDLGQVIIENNTSGASFVYNLSTNSYIPIPSHPDALGTNPYAINDSGTIVGTYAPLGGGDLGFSLSAGVFTDVVYPTGSTYSYPVAISNNGNLAGLNGSSALFQAYVKYNGTFAETNVPAAWGSDTTFFGINNAGIAAGGYQVAGGPQNLWSSVVYDAATDTFTPVAGPPGYAASELEGINDSGVMVGAAWNDLTTGFPIDGFIVDDGTWTLLDDPAAGPGGSTVPIGINNLGDVSGYYLDANGNVLPFVAVPVPELSTWVMMALGFMGLSFAAHRRTGPKDGASRAAG